MLFNTLEYFLFLPITFFLYWAIKETKYQNIFILMSSYVFYGWWDWRFLFLIFLSTVVDYFVAMRIEQTHKKKSKKIYLLISIIFNLSILGFFKYYNFFIDSWIELLSKIGYQVTDVWTLKIILPVGISFYTFQTMSYSLDVYRNEIKATKDFISFASFVSFFPQLIAGPIVHHREMMPQFSTLATANISLRISIGLSLIVFGLFKKAN